MNLIVAVDENWAIGYKNELLIRIPADMKMFRQETTGKVVVLGRNTLETFPGGQPLKNRKNIIYDTRKLSEIPTSGSKLKFYWGIATCYGCFCITAAKLYCCNRDHMGPKA